MVALPGLRFRPALAVTQASTALSIVTPGGAAVGIAGSYGMLRSLGFEGKAVGRAVTLTSLWNQFANLAYPIVAVFALAVTGAQTAFLATAAFVGAAILGVAVAALVLVLYSDRLAEDIGDAAARVDELGAREAAPQARSAGTAGASSASAATRSTCSSGAGTCSRSRPSPAASPSSSSCSSRCARCRCRRPQVSVIEAFAAWSLARLLGSIPITPGRDRRRRAEPHRDARRLRRQQRRRRRRRARLPLPDDGADARARPDRGEHLAPAPPCP